MNMMQANLSIIHILSIFTDMLPMVTQSKKSVYDGWMGNKSQGIQCSCAFHSGLGALIYKVPRKHDKSQERMGNQEKALKDPGNQGTFF